MMNSEANSPASMINRTGLKAETAIEVKDFPKIWVAVNSPLSAKDPIPTINPMRQT